MSAYVYVLADDDRHYVHACEGDLSAAIAAHDAAAGKPALLEGLDAALGASPSLPVTRAELLVRLGRRAEALPHYDAAIARTTLDAERDFLKRRRRRAHDPPR